MSHILRSDRLEQARPCFPAIVAAWARLDGVLRYSMAVAGTGSQSSVARLAMGMIIGRRSLAIMLAEIIASQTAHWAEETPIGKGLISAAVILFITDDKTAVSKLCIFRLGKVTGKRNNIVSRGAHHFALAPRDQRLRKSNDNEIYFFVHDIRFQIR